MHPAMGQLRMMNDTRGRITRYDRSAQDIDPTTSSMLEITWIVWMGGLGVRRVVSKVLALPTALTTTGAIHLDDRKPDHDDIQTLTKSVDNATWASCKGGAVVRASR